MGVSTDKKFLRALPPNNLPALAGAQQSTGLLWHGPADLQPCLRTENAQGAYSGATVSAGLFSATDRAWRQGTTHPRNQLDEGA